MRVLIATSQVPFVRGGAEVLTEGLLQAVRAAGHDAEIVSIPFKGYPSQTLLDHMLACQLLDLSEVMGRPVDRVIALGFPSYLVSSPRKTLWLTHQHRAATDQWSAPPGDLAREPDGSAVRAAVVAADRRALTAIEPRFSISRTVGARLEQSVGLASSPLYPPPVGAERFHCAKAEPFIFFPGRLDRFGRQALAVRALARSSSRMKLVIAGAHETASDRSAVEEAIASAGLGDRVSILSEISEVQRIDFYARCAAVLVPPLDEDYGYIASEAMLSGKPVITCRDSGAPAELVTNGQNGYVTEPTDEGVGAAIADIAANASKAAHMGRAGRERLRDLGISWPATVEKLLAP